jgi:hypothetical protein
MRLPVKLNANHWPRLLVAWLKGQPDPRCLLIPDLEAEQYTTALSTLKYGNTYKTTKKNRYPLTINLLADLYKDLSLNILDVGASDGTTSLDVMDRLNYQRYYITDLYFSVSYVITGRWTFFFDHNAEPIMAVDNHWIIYRDTKNAFYPLNVFVTKFFQKYRHLKPQADEKIELINPEVKACLGDRVIIKRYNILEHWSGEKVDLIIAANILNRSYFNDNELKVIMNNLINALNKPGWLALIDNRKFEQSSIIKYTDTGLSVVRRVRNGSDVEALIFGTLNKRT